MIVNCPPDYTKTATASVTPAGDHIAKSVANCNPAGQANIRSVSTERSPTIRDVVKIDTGGAAGCGAGGGAVQRERRAGWPVVGAWHAITARSLARLQDAGCAAPTRASGSPSWPPWARSPPTTVTGRCMSWASFTEDRKTSQANAIPVNDGYILRHCHSSPPVRLLLSSHALRIPALSGCSISPPRADSPPNTSLIMSGNHSYGSNQPYQQHGGYDQNQQYPPQQQYGDHNSQHQSHSPQPGGHSPYQGGHSPYGGSPYQPPPPQYGTTATPQYYGEHGHENAQHSGSHQQPPYISEPGAGGPPGSDMEPGGGVEGERGLGKAMLGGVAGGILGHKAGHGALGAIGGAIAANLLGGKDKKKRRDDRYGDDGLAYGSSHGGGSSYGGGGSSYSGHSSSHHGGGSYLGPGSAAVGGLYAGSQQSSGGSSHSGRRHHHHSHHHGSHRSHSRHSSRSRGVSDGEEDEEDRRRRH